MAELNLNVNVETKGADKLGSLSNNLKNAGKAAVIGVGAATAGIAALGAFTADFASDLNESLSKVGVVFGKNAKDIEKWSEDAAAAMGLSQQQALEAAGTFGNLFDSMGFAEKPTADMSKGLVELASDLASFNNISVDEALVKLRAGIVGEAEPLRQLGVNISAAATKSKALELGLIGAGDELTAADKAAANYAIILEQTTNAQGDFARTSEGMANQQRILGATFEDAMADIGQAFIPLIEMLLPQITAGLQGFAAWVTDNMPTIQAVIQTVLGAIGAAFNFVTTVIVPAVASAFQFVAGIFNNAGSQVSGLTQVFAGLVAWVQANLPTIMSVAGQVFGAVANVVKTVMPPIIELAKIVLPLLGTAAGILFKVLDVAFKGIGGAFEALGNVFETTAGFIGDVVGGVVGVFKGLYNAFASFWNSIDIDFPTIDVPFFGRIGGFSIGLPDIPMLAEGGIVTRPTLALIGEKGPEAVVPLDGSQTAGVTNFFTYNVQSPIPDEKGLVKLVTRSQRLQGMLAWD